MNKQVLNNNRKLIANLCCLVFFLMFIVIFARISYLSLSNKVDGIDLKKMATKRNAQKDVLYALRGNIYDTNGNVLAQTVNSYTVIAYLDPKISTHDKNKKHVENIEMTAEALSPIINMSKQKIIELLSRKNVYQVELGPGGKGITELSKEQIEELKLPGIDFITTHKRYYPNNDFASYTIGYTKDSDSIMNGEMGVELEYNDLLTGVNGHYKYVKDVKGYQIPNTPFDKKEAQNGYNVHLTLDSNIQMTVESAVKTAYESSNAEWVVLVVADAKTGKILGTSSSPSFNPNTKNISNYLNPLVSYAYEPGSTMKIFTYMAALENSDFKFSDTYVSEPFKIGDDTIRDWNKKGWGKTTYDFGFTISSNTGVVNLLKNYLSKEELKKQLLALGFGSKTGIELPNEYTGKIDFKYEVEVANAGFGQGITTTPIQHIKALTAIANNGVIINPTIIEKIEDVNNNKILYKSTIKKGKTVATKENTDILKEMMYKVVNEDSSITTGSAYKIDGYDLIGKTGTAQVFNTKTGKYEEGEGTYIKSFAGMYPKEDPKVIVYMAVKRSQGNPMPYTIATVVKDTAKYLNIFEESPEIATDVINYKTSLYTNLDASLVKSNLDEIGANYKVFGDGLKVINQYPKENINMNSKEYLYLFTNDSNTVIPNIIGYSYKDAKVVLDILNIDYEISGFGYVTSQSIEAGTLAKEKNKLIITCEL